MPKSSSESNFLKNLNTARGQSLQGLPNNKQPFIPKLRQISPADSHHQPSQPADKHTKSQQASANKLEKKSQLQDSPAAPKRRPSLRLILEPDMIVLRAPIEDCEDPELSKAVAYLEPKKSNAKDLAKDKQTHKVFDASKMWWCPDEKECFVACELLSSKGEDASVKIIKNNEKRSVKQAELQQMNPPRFEKCDDMADLTYLNDASVLYNLRQRYASNLLYTYSGLFCVSINPYCSFPIYGPKVMTLYTGRQRQERPPHLFAIADLTYSNLLRERESQSILITGESGAGKTENTKKVIQYFAHVAVAGEKYTKHDEPNLEDRIISANPLLESYGNAKTLRNNNSSRFGKFIRIHFSSAGAIAGADIETYLLEKSRVISQQAHERNYHIFYQLTSGAIPDLEKILLITTSAKYYHYINQGSLTADTIDDSLCMKETDRAIEILGFAQEEKLNLYKITAATMLFGNSKWKQRARAEQAECDGTEECEKVAYLIGIEATDLIQAILKPRIKVGMEFINKGQSKDQVTYSVGALAKSMYDRMFKWIVSRVNQTLSSNAKKKDYIGVLDIAGFEIFENNDFEQLCINYTNEKLQQFFNHHMFTREQEEYEKEKISWEFIDFGLDLQACIDLIGKPLGIFSILEEECILPKSSDATFIEKLLSHHAGKHPNFSAPKGQQRQKSTLQFEVKHYAGTVCYNVEGWLEKNRDPINKTAAHLFKNSKNQLMATIFDDMDDDENPKRARMSKKTGSMQTISAFHKEQLNRLMHNLGSTHPHFVRCILPNEHKTAGMFDPALVLQQLHCNGVLEGIRICRKGYPNRMIYSEFKRRYTILSPNVFPGGYIDAKSATEALLKSAGIAEECFKLGLTKVFLKAGVLGYLESLREHALNKIICQFQSKIRAYLSKHEYRKRLDMQIATAVLQKNCKNYLAIRNWSWWMLYTRLKPLLSVARKEEEFRQIQEEAEKLKVKLDKESGELKELRESYSQILNEYEKVVMELQDRRDEQASMQDQIEKLLIERAELEVRLKELENDLLDEDYNSAKLSHLSQQLKQDLSARENELVVVTSALERSEKRVQDLEDERKGTQADIEMLEQQISKLMDDKKKLQEEVVRLNSELQSERSKVASVTRSEAKLKKLLAEANEDLQNEQRRRSGLEQLRAKLESSILNKDAELDENRSQIVNLERTLKKCEQSIVVLTREVEDATNSYNSSTNTIRELQNKLTAMEEDLDRAQMDYQMAEKAKSELNEKLSLQSQQELMANSTDSEALIRKDKELEKLRFRLQNSEVGFQQQIEDTKRKHRAVLAESDQKGAALELKTQQLEKEKSGLGQQLVDLHNRIEKANFSNEQADRKIEHLTCDLQNTKRDLLASQNALDTQEQLGEELKLKIFALQETVDDLLTEKQSSKLTCQKLEVDSEQLRKELGEVERRLNNAQIHSRSTDQQLSHANEAISDNANTIAILEQRLSKADHESQSVKKHMQAEISAKASEIAEQRRNFQQKIDEVNAAREVMKLRVSALEIQASKFRNQCEDLTVQLERKEMKIGLMEKKERQMQASNVEAVEHSRILEGRLETLDEEYQNLNRCLAETRTELDAAIQETINASSDKKMREAKMNEMLKEIEALNESVKNNQKRCRAKETELEDRDNQIIELNESLAALQNSNRSLEAEVDKQKRNMERDRCTMENEMRALKEEHHSSASRLQGLLDEQREQTAAIQATSQRFQEELSVAEDEIVTRSDENSELRKLLRSKETQYAALDSELHALKSKHLTVSDDHALCAARLKKADNEADEYKSVCSQLEKDKKKRDTDISRMNQTVSETRDENNRLLSDVNQLRAELMENVDGRNEMESRLSELEQKLLKIEEDNFKVNQQLKEKTGQTQELSQAKLNLERKLRDTETRFQDHEQEHTSEIKKVKQKCDRKTNELATECDELRQKWSDLSKSNRNADKCARELQVKLLELEQSSATKEDIIQKLTEKIKYYKNQADSSQEIAEANLVKYRHAHSQANAAINRISDAESELLRLRARSRSSKYSSRLNTPEYDDSSIRKTKSKESL